MLDTFAVFDQVVDVIHLVKSVVVDADADKLLSDNGELIRVALVDEEVNILNDVSIVRLIVLLHKMLFANQHLAVQQVNCEIIVLLRFDVDDFSNHLPPGLKSAED